MLSVIIIYDRDSHILTYTYAIENVNSGMQFYCKEDKKKHQKDASCYSLYNTCYSFTCQKMSK